MKKEKRVFTAKHNRVFQIGKRLFCLLFAVMLLVGCSSSEEGSVFVTPEVTSNQLSEITHTTAASGGVVSSNGGSIIIEKGVCWSVETIPTIDDAKTREGDGTGSFSSVLTDLLPNTTYHLRAYATNVIGTSYGEVISFTTEDLPGDIPTIATAVITNITNITATSGGVVTSDGANAITARGICWSTIDMPTTTDFKTEEEAGTGSYISSITGLTSETKYYLRAYATNIKGTAYGDVVSFTTTKVLFAPTLTTTAISELANGTAKSGGTISADGGSAISAKGVCWSLSSNPTIADNKSENGAGTDNFISDVIDLRGRTTYYLRAYATNAIGTSYGEEVSFTTGDKEYTGDVYLKNQNEVNYFGSLGYTSINGDLIIEPAIPTHFSGLDALQSIRSIEGVLTVSKTKGLTDLSGLKNVVAIGRYISLSYNQGLTTIGLDGLSAVREYINILYNENLLNLDGLENLQTSGGKPDMNIWSNTKLTNYCAIQSLLTTHTGVFSVMSNEYNPTKQNIIDGNCSE